MKKFVLAAALALALPFSGKAAAQAQEYGTEVCVNVSLVDEAKRLFPDARLHVIPDSPRRGMNGWRIVSGNVRPDGRIHTDEEEIALRRRDLLNNGGLATE